MDSTQNTTKTRLICPRCHRPVESWPLARRDGCSPAGWVSCIRMEHDVRRDIERRSYCTLHIAHMGPHLYVKGTVPWFYCGKEKTR